MNIFLGYGLVAAFLGLIVFVLEATQKKSATFTEYAVAGRSFGSWFQTMSFINTWLPGTFFISFAGLSAASGVIGFYVISYSLLAVLFMIFMADKVYSWGHHFDLRTQADFVGMRYNSNAVRVVAAIIGIVSSLPWLVLGFQSLGLVFSYLSFGSVGKVPAILIGIAVLAIRQTWTVRLGMRGIVISDMIQGIVAYGLGFLLALGLLVWLLTHGFGFTDLPASFAIVPGFGTPAGPLYLMSIVLTGALGAWCWPDIFVRLFTARNAATVKSSALKSGPILLIFSAVLLTMAMLAHSLPRVAAAPDDVWFIVASKGGAFALTLAGICVLGATMGNVNATTAAIGTQAAQDIIHVRGRASDQVATRSAKWSTVGVTLVAVIGAIIAANTTAGLVTLALVSYQGIVQLAPSLLLGIFWRRGNAAGAIGGMTVGFAVAAILQTQYSVSIGWLGGLTSGVAGLIVNAVIYVGFAFARPADQVEGQRVDDLFTALATAPSAHSVDPVIEDADQHRADAKYERG